VSYTADALNRYTAVGAVNPTYDANSNLTSDGAFTLGYDSENRLTSASGAGNTASYTWDARGRRKTKTVNGNTTVFVTDAGNREVLEYDGATGAIQRWYAYGLGSNDVLSQMNVVAGTRATLVPDIQGSVIGSMDSSSGVLSKSGYLPYGRSASALGTFGYTAQRIDPEIGGMYYYRARHYSPAWGRFLQTDPIGYRGGLNLFAYVGNDPLNLLDPMGLAGQGYGYGYGANAMRAADNLSAGNYGKAAYYELLHTAETFLAITPFGALENALAKGATAVGGGSQAGLSFSQSTASPFFSSQGAFAGESIASVATQLRAGSLAVSDVPVQTVTLGGNTLIVNTRSALSLMQGSIPQSEWTLINMTGNAATEAQITQRLINNGLTTSGTGSPNYWVGFQCQYTCAEMISCRLNFGKCRYQQPH
jgi:RHS repeat-associated protein